MFIPVINKTIVYSDVVLPLKELGNNLKVHSISNVDEHSLESCVKIIFKSNPNILFNTIQYSKKNKKVYFYTNKTISTKAWEESKVIRYEPLNSNVEILEEFKKIFASEKNMDTECISLYDILELVKSKNARYREMKKSYDSELQSAINRKYYDVGIYISEYDFKHDELVIQFRYLEKYDEIRFSKNNGDLHITKSETYFCKEILTILGDILSRAYDDFKEYNSFREQYKYGLKTVNSIFLVDINSFIGVRIYSRCLSKKFGNDFELNSNSYGNDYNYDCNSNTVISAIYGKEDELLKKLFIRIDDCPEWSKQLLYQIRQEQLNIELKKEKKLSLKRKIFPWLNK